MGFEAMVHQVLQTIVTYGKVLHLPVLTAAFVVGVVLRVLIYHTVKRHAWFCREFEVRTSRFLTKEADTTPKTSSFYVITKRLLEMSFYEVFEARERERKEKPDKLMLMSDRLFLIKMGCAWLVHDIMKQIRFLKYGSQPPKLLNIAKHTFSKNPAFNRVLGVVDSVAVNDFLNILPGLFVIGGIFGTFLGVMQGLPELGGMNLDDPEKTKAIMDRFLVEISLSMGASIKGILLSVLMTLVNTAFNPERLFGDIIDRLEVSLDLLWNYAHSNEVPTNLKSFDENLDPREALAAAALNQELDKSRDRHRAEETPTAKSA